MSDINSIFQLVLRQLKIVGTETGASVSLSVNADSSTAISSRIGYSSALTRTAMFLLQGYAA